MTADDKTIIYRVALLVVTVVLTWLSASVGYYGAHYLYPAIGDITADIVPISMILAYVITYGVIELLISIALCIVFSRKLIKNFHVLLSKETVLPSLWQHVLVPIALGVAIAFALHAAGIFEYNIPSLWRLTR